MEKASLPFGDLIDTAPLLEVADRLVSRCCDAARSADKGWYRADNLHDWAVERYGAHDDLVRMAMNALFARDCAWGVADLDHPGLDRYAWELAAEIEGDGRGRKSEGYREYNWLFPVGSFESCGARHEVLLEWPYPWIREVPYVLVRLVHFPTLPCVGVGLFEPVYIPHHHRHWQFDDRHRDDFAAFMESPAEGREGWTNWDVAAAQWIDARPEGTEEGPREHVLGEVPDYRSLHWPERSQAEGDGEPC